MKRTTINLQGHDNLTRKRGEVVEIHKSRKCGCGEVHPDMDVLLDQGHLQQDMARSNPSCPICKGNGIYWIDPFKMKVLISDVQQSAKQLLQSGMAAPGDLTMSPPPLSNRGYRINDLDKVVFNHRGGQQYEGDILVRGQYDETFDFSAYPIAQIESVGWYNKTTEVVVECLKAPQETDNPDYSFVVGEKTITWLGGPNQPPIGTEFSISYFCYYEWIAFVSPFIRVEAGNLLGPKCLLKKRHTIGMN